MHAMAVTKRIVFQRKISPEKGPFGYTFEVSKQSFRRHVRYWPKADIGGPYRYASLKPIDALGEPMKRRDFITLLGGAAATWPFVARAQQREQIARIGVLMNAAAEDPEGQSRFAVFRQALQKLGWTEGQNVRIDVRWAAAEAVA